MEAKNALPKAQALHPEPQLLMSSPLTRALETAEISFESFKGQRLALSLARERTYFASDVGIPRYSASHYADFHLLAACPINSE